nr:MAK10-like protein [Tanacetum cinerariifolium]
MGDENPICTHGDYSKPSHKGYRNTIELPIWNNMIPLRSDTIQLVLNGCSFHRLRSEDPNQHLTDFLKLVDSLNLDGENKERTRLRCREIKGRNKDGKNRVKKIEKIIRESTFGFKPDTRNNQNIKSQHDPDPQSTPQVHPSFEENIPPVTYPDKVEKIIGILIEVEPSDETPLEDLGLNIYSHYILLSSKEIPNFDESERQPQPLPNYPP